jgi:oligopeptide transport system substrate-binding protein
MARPASLGFFVALRIITLGGALACFFPACAKKKSPAIDLHILRLSQRNEPADLDPAKSSLPDDFFVIRALSEGLLTPDGAGGPPEPAAAERWEVSADGLVYTFHLRADAKWSNGEPVTATDFVASYQRVLTPATAAPKANLFFPVKNAREFVTGTLADFSAVGFRAADDRTLVVTLEQPTPNFPVYVASGAWIPVNPRVVAQHGRNWTRPENFVGNGPFTLDEWRPHQWIVVKRNPGYHGARSVQLGEIQFLAFDNGDSEERAYRAGQVDVTMSVPATKLETYARERPDEFHQTPLAETHYLAFNTRRAPLNDARVRRALARAIDRRQLVERVLRGGQQVANRFLPPSLPGVPVPPGPLSGALAHDPEEAKRLLAEAGFPGGKNFPRLELSSWARPAVLEAIQAMWRETLGIEVAIVMREAKVHTDALRTGNYDIGFITQIPDVADPLNILADFATDAPDNFAHWSEPAYDALLKDAGRTAVPMTRRELLIRLEGELIESAAVAPLYFNTKNWLMTPRVHGWREDSLWTRDYRDVSVDAAPSLSSSK